MQYKFSSFEVGKILDIPRERIRAWMKDGFISPTFPSPGQGSRAIFTLDRLYCVALFQSLLNRGFNRKTAASIADEFWGSHEWHSKDYKNTYYEDTITTEYIIICFNSDDTGEIPYIYTAQPSSSENPPLLNLLTLDVTGVASWTRTGKTDGKWKHVHIINFGEMVREVNEQINLVGQ